MSVQGCVKDPDNIYVEGPDHVCVEDPVNISFEDPEQVCVKRPDSQYFSEALARAYDTKEATDLILSTKDGLKIEAHQVNRIDYWH